MLFYVLLRRVVLCCVVLCNESCRRVSYCDMSDRVVSCPVYGIVSCRVVLCRVVSCCASLCYTVLCCGTIIICLCTVVT